MIFQPLCHATNLKLFVCNELFFSFFFHFFWGDPDTVNATEFSFLLLELWFLHAYICLLYIAHYACYKLWEE